MFLGEQEEDRELNSPQHHAVIYLIKIETESYFSPMLNNIRKPSLVIFSDRYYSFMMMQEKELNFSKSFLDQFYVVDLYQTPNNISFRRSTEIRIAFPIDSSFYSYSRFGLFQLIFAFLVEQVLERLKFEAIPNLFQQKLYLKNFTF